uniref:GG23889 n=1 Tax=Drosophila erecta TaxID=7220 RepID=B3NYZ4_DROER
MVTETETESDPAPENQEHKANGNEDEDARPDKWAQREEPGQVPVMVEIRGRLRNFPTANATDCRTGRANELIILIQMETGQESIVHKSETWVSTRIISLSGLSACGMLS